MTAPPPADSSTFTFPRGYYYPPFFTLQNPLTTTYHAQCMKWSYLITTYCKHHRKWKLSLTDAMDTDLFWNKKIEKRLALDDARKILDFMQQKGTAEWIVGESSSAGGRDGKKNMAWIWWRTPDEWAMSIRDWVEETGQKNVVLTLYELTESEATISQAFHGMDPGLLHRAMNILVKRGEAQVFGQEDQLGVKFFGRSKEK